MMEKKYYKVTVILSNGSSIVKKEIKAFSAEEAWIEACEKQMVDYASIIDDKNIYHKINMIHVIEIVIQDIGNPEQRQEKLENKRRALKGFSI